MNPHFIHNALNSIQNYIFRGDPENANYLLSRFSKLMRSSLKLSKLEYITIETEIEFLENYLELEKMRFEDKFDYIIDLESPDLNQMKIPPLLIQPLMENSIKHGFDGKTTGKLTLEITADTDYVTITVKDNGKGYKPSQKEESSDPSALKIIRDRLNIINQGATKKSAFTIKSINKDGKRGTIATLKLAKQYESTDS